MTVTINGTTGVAGVDGTAATPAIQGNDTNTGIFFPAADTIAFAEGGAEVARFDSNGRLGVGVASPTQKLDVSGLVQSQNNAGSNDSIVGAYNFYNTNPSASANPNRASIVAGRENSAWGAYLQFNTSTGTSAVSEVMRLDSTGNLLAGLTSFTGTPGVITVQGVIAQKYAIRCQVTETGSNGQISFQNPNGLVGQITTSGGSTTYATSSDYRLKENISPMTGALSKVVALKPCTYTWKADGSNGEGFIAHELAEVCPDAVTGEKDAVDSEGNIKPQGIDTSFLVATLTAAIQEQQAIITDLKSRIEALEQA
jgi:hypothetical protein